MDDQCPSSEQSLLQNPDLDPDQLGYLLCILNDKYMQLLDHQQQRKIDGKRRFMIIEFVFMNDS